MAKNLRDKITLAWLKVDKIVIDGEINRPEIEAWKRRIIRDFDYRLFGGIVVNRRQDGTYVVIEGQHRFLAAKELGYPEVPCVIINLRTRAAESEVVAKSNSQRRKFPAVIEFRNLLQAGKEPEVSIDRIITQAGLRISISDAGDAIECVVVLRRLYRRGVLERTATVITMAFEVGTPKSLNGSLWEGTAYVLGEYGGLNADRLIERMSVVTPDGILRRAQGKKERLGTGVSTPVALAYVLLDMYNDRLKRGRLDPMFLTDYFENRSRSNVAVNG